MTTPVASVFASTPANAADAHHIAANAASTATFPKRFMIAFLSLASGATRAPYPFDVAIGLRLQGCAINAVVRQTHESFGGGNLVRPAWAIGDPNRRGRS